MLGEVADVTDWARAQVRWVEVGELRRVLLPKEEVYATRRLHFI